MSTSLSQVIEAQRPEITTKFVRGLLIRLRIVDLLFDEAEKSVADLVARLE